MNKDDFVSTNKDFSCTEKSDNNTVPTCTSWSSSATEVDLEVGSGNKNNEAVSSLGCSQYHCEEGEEDDNCDDLSLGPSYLIRVPAISKTAAISKKYPIAGEGEREAANNSRLVDGACSICLKEYEFNDKVVWASRNSSCVPSRGASSSPPSLGWACPHVFHSECMVQWLSRRQKNDCSRRRDRNSSRSTKLQPPECPMCRQLFIHTSDDENLSLANTSIEGGTANM